MDLRGCVLLDLVVDIRRRISASRRPVVTGWLWVGGLADRRRRINVGGIRGCQQYGLGRGWPWIIIDWGWQVGCQARIILVILWWRPFHNFFLRSKSACNLNWIKKGIYFVGNPRSETRFILLEDMFLIETTKDLVKRKKSINIYRLIRCDLNSAIW